MYLIIQSFTILKKLCQKIMLNLNIELEMKFLNKHI